MILRRSSDYYSVHFIFLFLINNLIWY